MIVNFAKPHDRQRPPDKQLLPKGAQSLINKLIIAAMIAAILVMVVITINARANMNMPFRGGILHDRHIDGHGLKACTFTGIISKLNLSGFKRL